MNFIVTYLVTDVKLPRSEASLSCHSVVGEELAKWRQMLLRRKMRRTCGPPVCPLFRDWH